MMGEKLVFFETVREPWNEYNLADGNVLHVKTILLKVTSPGTKNPDGSPVYNFQTKVVARVFTEEEGYVRTER